MRTAQTVSTTVSILLLAALGAPGSAAWTPATRVHMVDEAMRLMPESLRMALEGKGDLVRRGMLEPLVDEDGADHRPPWDDGRLDQALAAESRSLVEALRRGNDFDEISRRFGRVAHFVIDAGFPPAMEPGAHKRYTHFASFCESRLPKFPLVFYGHDEDDVPQPYRDRALDIMQRALDDDRLLARAYAAAGDPPAESHFDDRSVPFAVGSLAYSRGVTDIVRVWLAAWSEASGDMGRTPFLGIEQELTKD